jgi:hypothetical protein
MNHLSEEELILHYYGEEGDAFAAEHHLDECDECRAHYGSLQRVLNVVDTLPVPARGDEYGREVWRSIAGRLPARRRWTLGGSWLWAGTAAACASLLVAAFLAGRMFPTAHRPTAHTPAATAETAADKQAGERVLLVAVGDFLERSQMVLIELTNANPDGKPDISAEQGRAADLVNENRLYRQTALHNGNTAMAGVLDELERVLVDIAHQPAQMAPGDLETLQHRLESAGILFKIRVLGSNVKNRQEPARPEGRPADRQKL